MGEQRLLLSNLDLLLPHVDVSVFLCYNMPRKQNSLPFASMTRILQNSLGQTLVSFYPLAGEVVMGSRGEPELLCNNRGVDFMEAYADVELRELQLYNLDASMEGKLVPKNRDGVLCIRATELRCGAVIVVCTFGHRIADAYKINMFLVAWAEMAHSQTISVLPSFQRSLLNPRCSGSCDVSMDDVHTHVNTVSSPMADL